MTDPVAAGKAALPAKTAEVLESPGASHAYEDFMRGWPEAETKGFDLVASFEGNSGGSAYEADQQAAVMATQIKSLFWTEDWVYICVNNMASKISSQPCRVVKRTVKDHKLIFEPAEGHPVQARIDNPNLYQDYSAFMYVVCVDEALGGNGIIWKADSLQSLIPLPFELIRLDLDANRIKRYVVQQWYDLQAGLGARPSMMFDPKEIIHVRRPNPSNLLWGMSPAFPGARSINFNKYSGEFLNNFYEKGATPGMALEMDKEANETNVLRLLRSFEQAYTGRKNQRKTMVLPKGVSMKQLTATLADQELIDHINTNRETIIAIWGVPKHEVSLADSGSLGSEEAKQALKNYWQSSLIPMTKRIEGALTKAFSAELGKDYVIQFDLSNVEVLREDELRKAQLADQLLTTHTLNEVRANVYDDPPLPGGDVTPSKAPSFGGGAGGGFGGVPQLPGGAAPDPAGEGKAITVDAKAGGAVETPVGISSDPVREEIPEAQKAKAQAIKAAGGWFDKRQQQLEKKTAPLVSAMQKHALDHFEDVAVASVKSVTKYLKAKNYVPGRTKFVKPRRTKAEGDEPKTEIISKAGMRKALRSAISSLEEKWVDGGVKILEGSADIGYDAQLDVPFKLPDPAAIEALRTEGKTQRRAILEDRELRGFAYMSDTTSEEIMKLVEAGVAKGQTIQKIAESIADKFTDIPNIESRSLVIARTETLTAASIGQAAAMADLAEVVPDLEKTWISTHDNRTRGPGSIYKWQPGDADHVSLDGVTVKHDEPFPNGLMYPRDPNGAADQTIQCRCGFAVLPKDFKL